MFWSGAFSRLCCSGLSIRVAGERRKRGLEAPRAWAGPDSRGPGQGNPEVTPPQPFLPAGPPPDPLRPRSGVPWLYGGGPGESAAKEGGGFLSSAGRPRPNSHIFVLSPDVSEPSTLVAVRLSGRAVGFCLATPTPTPTKTYRHGRAGQARAQWEQPRASSQSEF